VFLEGRSLIAGSPVHQAAIAFVELAAGLPRPDSNSLRAMTL